MYYKYICSSNYFAISNGMGDGNFGIGRYISRQDAATIIYRVAMLKRFELNKQNTAVHFADAPVISEYAKEAVSTLSAVGILSGNINGYFEPNSVATRAQVAMNIKECCI